MNVCKNYCCRTKEATTLNESQLIEAINIIFVVSWPFCFIMAVISSQYKMKCHFFGDVNISVNGNQNILKFAFPLDVYYGNQKCNHFNIGLYIAVSYQLFIPVGYVKLHP